MSTSYIPDIVISTDTMGKKIVKHPCFYGIYILLGETFNIQYCGRDNVMIPENTTSFFLPGYITCHFPISIADMCRTM